MAANHTSVWPVGTTNSTNSPSLLYDTLVRLISLRKRKNRNFTMIQKRADRLIFSIFLQTLSLYSRLVMVMSMPVIVPVVPLPEYVIQRGPLRKRIEFMGHNVTQPEFPLLRPRALIVDTRLRRFQPGD